MSILLSMLQNLLEVEHLLLDLVLLFHQESKEVITLFISFFKIST